MKKTFIAIIVAVFAFTMSCSQTTFSQSCQDNGKYRLYQTENIWTFLKLDTETGQIWQLQYSINGDNTGEMPLNTVALNKDGKLKRGRYELYPTRNMYNFLLLDKETGSVYQAQWSIDAANRGIVNVISD